MRNPGLFARAKLQPVLPISFSVLIKVTEIRVNNTTNRNGYAWTTESVMRGWVCAVVTAANGASLMFFFPLVFSRQPVIFHSDASWDKRTGNTGWKFGLFLLSTSAVLQEWRLTYAAVMALGWLDIRTYSFVKLLETDCCWTHWVDALSGRTLGLRIIFQKKLRCGFPHWQDVVKWFVTKLSAI